MKIKLFIFIIYLFSAIINVNAQTKQPDNNLSADYYLNSRGEVYFSFKIDNSKEILEFTKIVSIDNVKKDADKFIVYAYANKKQFNKFKTIKNKYQVELPPSMVYEAVMSSNAKEIADWDTYPTYENYVAMMNTFATTYPNLCTLDTIGTSVNNRLLLVMKISDNVATEESEPEFYYTSTMHGDEPTGYVLMLHLIDYMLSNYGTIDKITNLVDNFEIYINPLSNPDGTYAGGNSTVNGATRLNANGVDLNRNYPDPQAGPHPDGNSWQVENIAQMNFMEQHSFVMSVNFHTGSEVVNYPWDTWQKLHIDDTWYQFISREYADTVHAVNSSYMDGFDNGITNGYAWYSVYGGRQDYANYFLQCREVTIELSNIKTPPASSLPNYWNYNYKSLLNYIEQCQYGIKGIVTDEDGEPLSALITILDHDADSSCVYTDPDHGNYYRPIEEGTWNMTVSSYGYIPQTFYYITTTNYQAVIHNVELVKAETVNISGTVIDGLSGTAIENASIKILDTPIDNVYSDETGNYSILGILEGNYNIKVTKAGYTVSSQFVNITQNDTVFNFTLYPSTAISFESSDFSEADFSFSGDADWTVDQNTVYEGTYSAKSGTITNNQSSTLELSVDVLQEGEISFYYKVSSESGYDYLTFYIDGTQQTRWSGEVDWAEANYSLSVGEHILKWEYSKDASASSGSDAAWIDYIVLPLVDNGLNYPPVFESTPNTSAPIDQEYMYRIAVADLNSSDVLTISCPVKPEWLTFEEGSANHAVLSGTPTFNNIGLDTLKLLVTDEIDTTEQNFTISVISDDISILSANQNIVIYPNPATSSINLKFHSTSRNYYKIQILDITGKRILNLNKYSHTGINNINIPLSNLSEGVYFIYICDNEQIIRSKFIKTH